MDIVKKGIGYLISDNLCLIFSLIIFNLFTYILRFSTYRSLTEFISGIVDVGSNGIYFILFGFFLKLLLLQIIHSYTFFLLEKIVIRKVKNIFDHLVSKIMYYRIDFFKNHNNHKISQLWFYLSSIEILIEKLILELPRIIAFLCYYFYTIYSFSLNAIFIIIALNIMCIYLLHPISKKQYKFHQNITTLDLETKNKLLEATSNIEYVKLKNKQDYEIKKVRSSYRNYTVKKIEDKIITSYLSTVSEVVSDSLTLIIYSIGIAYVLQGNMKPIELLYLAVHTGHFYYHIMQLKDIYNFYNKVYPKIKIIDEFISYNKVEKINDTNRYENDILYDISNDGIVYKNVSFSYDNKTDIIKNLSFEFKCNKINILLGPNGSGKSTIIKLLLRLYDLDQRNGNNKIYYKGKNIKYLSLFELRNNITYVSQDPSIFNDTIWNNIVYGNEDISFSKILQMCEILDSREWIEYEKDKKAGFRGKNLSGGEKKKIQLINAICRNTDVIIFDEPSNALDSNAIKWFIDFIKKLKHNFGKTIIIITHDLRLTDVSDHIVNLNIIKE